MAMTVGQLRKLLDGVDDDLVVLIPVSQEFDGAFYSPCPAESGVSTMGTDPDIDDEDIAEMELLNQPLPEEDHFLLIPCGFYDEKDHSHELN